MSDDNITGSAEAETTEVEATPVEQPYESEGARRIRIREANKAEAAVTMKEEAEKATRRKARRLGKAAGLEGMAEFNKLGREIEKEINTKPAKDEEEES